MLKLIFRRGGYSPNSQVNEYTDCARSIQLKGTKY